MSELKYQIRVMARKELDIAINWATQEGWNPGLHDAECFYSTDPKGFFMGFLGQTPVSCISAVAYDKHFGFIGFYIVKPKYRGQGYGFKIWQHAMKYLGNRNIGLDGVVQEQPKYKKFGFKLVYRNIRYAGKTNKLIQFDPTFKGNTLKGRTTKLSDMDFKVLEDYDKQLFQAPRKQFLKCWISQPGCVSLARVDQGRVVGYGVIRPCRKGYKIGPLFADNLPIADSLFRSLTGSIKSGSDVFLDVPEVNLSGLKLARRYHMTKVFETARMYSQAPPHLPLNKIFGVTTFELG